MSTARGLRSPLSVPVSDSAAAAGPGWHSPSMEPPPPIAPLLAALFAKADGFVARVESRHRDQLRCGSGCASCCLGGLTVTPLEAEAVCFALARFDDATLHALHARPVDPARCALLDAEDRCTVYAARPLVCRTHGIPIRTASTHGLPVVSSCELNFIAQGPAAADADCILDQGTLSTLLAAVNAAAGKTTDRHALRDLLDDAAATRGRHNSSGASDL